MSSHKNEKNYNRQVMESGLKSNQYINESLKNLNNYTNNYAERLDYWAEKVNNRQLDLLSDNYLAQNSQMLRNMAAFGSNSETNRQIEENAYDQAQYLANVANTNLQAANALQNNELNALYNNVNLNYSNRDAGGQAAKNLDSFNNSWLGWLGGGLSAAGSVVSAVAPGWGTVIGAGLSGIGNTLTTVSQPTTMYANQQRYGTNLSPQTINYFTNMGNQLSNKLNLGQNSSSNSTLSAQTNFSNSNTISSSINNYVNRNTLDVNSLRL